MKIIEIIDKYVSHTHASQDSLCGCDLHRRRKEFMKEIQLIYNKGRKDMQLKAAKIALEYRTPITGEVTQVGREISDIIEGLP